MSRQCPKCGAILQDDQTCQMIFDEFLTLELTDSNYGQVDLLSGACFRIQHGQYTDEALVWIEKRIREFLEQGVPVEEIRQKNIKQTGQLGRAWKVTRGPGDPPQAKVPWSMTIVDVAARFRDADSYCEWIRKWAQVTIEEMKPLLRSKA